MSSDKIVFTARKVLLPTSDEPVAATIEVSRATGKITRIATGSALREAYPADVEFIDAGGATILPGLVEYVHDDHYTLR